MEFRPCIDIHNGKVKQIVGGSLRDAGDHASENFVSEQDAAFYAHLYQELGIGGGHVILLNPVSSPYYEATREQAMSALRAWPGGLQVGGGITPENAADFLDAGASHVIVTSYVFRDGTIDFERLAHLVSAVGRDRLVLDLSCRKYSRSAVLSDDIADTSAPCTDASASCTGASASCTDASAPVTELLDGHYYVVTDRWQKFTNTEITPQTLEILTDYCAEFLVHAADVEGKQEGVDAGLISILASFTDLHDSVQRSVHSSEPASVPDFGYTLFPITYAGGIGSFSDLEVLREAGKNRLNVTIGSALDLFGGSMPLSHVLETLRFRGD